MLLMLFNMMFTASPIVVYGIVEKHIPIRSLETEASLYRKITRNRNMRFSMFLAWFFNWFDPWIDTVLLFLCCMANEHLVRWKVHWSICLWSMHLSWCHPNGHLQTWNHCPILELLLWICHVTIHLLCPNLLFRVHKLQMDHPQ